MVIKITLPKYNETKRKTKFGNEPTVPCAIRIPQSTKEKIKDKNLDIPQIVYDIVEKDLDPYISLHNVDVRTLNFQRTLLLKFIKMFMTLHITFKAQKMKIDLNAGIDFTPEEDAYIEAFAEEIEF